MTRILFLRCGINFIPTEIPLVEYYRGLSNEYEGDILAVVHRWDLRTASLGNFKLVGLYLPYWIRKRSILRDIAFSIFALIQGPIRHWFQGRYAVVLCKEPLVTGVLAVMLGKTLGCKSVVEVNGNFESAFRVNAPGMSLVERVKAWYAKRVIPYVLGQADGVKLVYPLQLNGLNLTIPSSRTFAFPNFVPISQFTPSDEDQRYVLFCGFPWHLKGVDILIRAFQQMTKEFPDVRLKVVGYCQDRSPYQALAEGNSRIELCDPVGYEQIKSLMENCTVFVLPSRTDSSPRVLREAMAAKKPIIASNVDGIPYLIRDRYHGLLFESENVEDLAAKLRVILRDPGLARTLAENGLVHVREALSEAEYLRQFSNMITQITFPHAH